MGGKESQGVSSREKQAFFIKKGLLKNEYIFSSGYCLRDRLRYLLVARIHGRYAQVITLRYLVLFLVLLLPSVKAHAGFTTLYDSRCYPDMQTAALAFSGANMKFENGYMSWVNINSVTPALIYYMYTRYDMTAGAVTIQRSDSTPLLSCTSPLVGSDQYYENLSMLSLASMVSAASSLQATETQSSYYLASMVSAASASAATENLQTAYMASMVAAANPPLVPQDSQFYVDLALLLLGAWSTGYGMGLLVMNFKKFADKVI
jgi:hypothetical protein